MRPLPSEPFGDDQSPAEVGERAVDTSTAIRPTFTPAAGEADDATPDEEAVQTPTVVESADDYPDAGTHERPTAYGTSAAPTARPGMAAPAAVSATPAPAASSDLDQPLLSGDPELLARWHRVQLEFIDDPQVAVADAADIVEQAGQALVDTLRQRQRQMRTMWDHSSAAARDTEQLRHVMQYYRALFNQLYQPV